MHDKGDEALTGDDHEPMSSAEELAIKRRRQAEWAERAAEDERRTRRYLDDRLVPLGFHCLHDCRWPGSAANIDHVVIGPTGVFVVDDKHSTAAVNKSSNGRYYRGRFGFDADFRKLRAQLEAVSKAVGHRVDGVLAIHGGGVSDEGEVVGDDIALVEAESLADLLLEQAPEIPTTLLGIVARRAETALKPRHYGRPSAPPPAHLVPSVSSMRVPDTVEALLHRAGTEAPKEARPGSVNPERSPWSVMGDVLEAFGRLIVVLLGWMATALGWIADRIGNRSTPAPARRRRSAPRRSRSRRQSQSEGGIGALILAGVIIFVVAPNIGRSGDEPTTAAATTASTRVFTGGPVQLTDAYDCPRPGGGWRHTVSWTGGDGPFALVSSAAAEGPWDPIPISGRQAVREGVAPADRRVLRLQYATASGQSEASILSSAPAGAC